MRPSNTTSPAERKLNFMDSPTSNEIIMSLISSQHQIMAGVFGIRPRRKSDGPVKKIGLRVGGFQCEQDRRLFLVVHGSTHLSGLDVFCSMKSPPHLSTPLMV